MQAGKLRHRITIQTRTDTQDGFWAAGCVMGKSCHQRASRETRPIGRELDCRAGHVHSETTTEFVIRYRSGSDAKARVTV